MKISFFFLNTIDKNSKNASVRSVSGWIVHPWIYTFIQISTLSSVLSVPWHFVSSLATNKTFLVDNNPRVKGNYIVVLSDGRTYVRTYVCCAHFLTLCLESGVYRSTPDHVPWPDLTLAKVRDQVTPHFTLRHSYPPTESRNPGKMSQSEGKSKD